MVNPRDLAALVLLAQLMTVSGGTDIKEIGVIEEILPNNLSILLIDDKVGKHTGATMKNVTTLNIEPNISKDNDSMILNELMEKERMLEAELEEAIEGAAASGQVILVPPPANATNSTKQPPLIVIEAIEAKDLESAINDTSSDKAAEKTRRSSDEEIAQSRIHKRSVTADNDYRENPEDLDDLLAIADYEPQRIDAKKVKQETSRNSNAKKNYQEKTTSPPVEKIHYDVPKNGNSPAKLTKPNLEQSSTDHLPPSSLPSKLDPIEIKEEEIKAEKLTSSPSTYLHEPIVVLSESLRDRRNPKIVLTTTISPLQIRLPYSLVPPRLNPINVSSVRPILLPESSVNIERRLINSRNPASAAGPFNQIIRPRVGAFSTAIPSNHRSASENETLYAGGKLIESSLSPSGSIQANRRIDYYLTPEYLASLNRKPQPLINEQLGYLTRYNQPSLLTGNPRLRPAAARLRQIEAPKPTQQSLGIPDPRRPRIINHARNSYDLQGRQIASRPPGLDYGKDGRSANLRTTPISNSYEEAEEATPDSHRQQSAAYQRNKNQPQSSELPVNESYEEDDEETVRNDGRVENAAYRRNGNQPLASTTPAEESYEDDEEDEEETAPNRRVENSAYQGNRNPQPVPTTPFDFYENYKKSASKKTTTNTPTASHEDYKESGNSRTVNNSPEASSEEDSPSRAYDDSKGSGENSATDRNSPTTPYDDYASSAENANIVENSSAASYEDSKEAEENSKLSRNSPSASYEDSKESAESSKIARNSPSTSYEDSGESDEKSKIARNSANSYEDYGESENSKLVKNSRESPASSAPVEDSYEDYRESQAAKSSKNGPGKNAYETYEETDDRNVVPQQQSLIANGAGQRKRLPINSYPARTVQPVAPINLSNNPIYKLHGLKTTAAPVSEVYNPYASYSTRIPSRVASNGIQNTQIPRATITSQRIVTTTPVYDYYEDAAANNPSVAVPRAANPNYPQRRIAETTYSDKNIENTSIAPLKTNYRADSYTVIPPNAISPHSPRGTSQPQRNLQRAIGRVSSPAHAEAIDAANEDDGSIVRRPYATGTRKLRVPKASQYAETNQATSPRSTPEDDSYDGDDGEISASPAGRGQLNAPLSADYGNRIRTRVAEKRGDRVVAPASTQASSTAPTRRRRVKKPVVNQEDLELVRVDEDGLPVATVNRPNARVSLAPDDEVPAGSEHEENYETHEAAKKKHADHKHEEGGGEEHEEKHHGEHGEKEDKGYKNWHEHDKAEKGHHDKESHDKEYEEKKGDKKKHKEESDYHKEHHHEEKGEKEAEFAEKGEHQKGHSTKGQHVVHKKDEYEKKTEFYDESHEEDGEEKEGEHHMHHESEKGGHEKSGHHDSAHHDEKHGEKGEHEKGHHYHEHKGHKESDGHDEHHHHEEKYGKKGGHEEGKKWSHKKGDNGKKDS